MAPHRVTEQRRHGGPLRSNFGHEGTQFAAIYLRDSLGIAATLSGFIVTEMLETQDNLALVTTLSCVHLSSNLLIDILTLLQECE